MSPKQKVWIRLSVFLISLITVVYFQRSTGRSELLLMLIGLSGILWSLYDYNRGYH